MSDQAQGLRALVDQARRDHSGHPLSGVTLPNGEDRENRVAATPASPPELRTYRGDSQHALVDARRHDHHAVMTTSLAPSALKFDLTTRRHARVVAVTSGKGGVGKTNFSTNLSLTLARSGQRLIVVDADLGLANLHVILGIAPQFHLEHVMRGEKTLREVLCTGPGGIQIIGGGSGITELANLNESGRRAFIEGLTELDDLADMILIDTGAGLSRNVLAFLCAVEEVIVLTTPEPTAITDAYATIKVVSQENPTARLMLVVNMAQSEAEAEAVANRLMQIAQQFLHVELHWLGFIPQDSAVTKAVRAQQPFVLSHPASAAATAISRIAGRLGYSDTDLTREGMGGFLNRMQRFFGFRQPGAY